MAVIQRWLLGGAVGLYTGEILGLILLAGIINLPNQVAVSTGSINGPVVHMTTGLAPHVITPGTYYRWAWGVILIDTDSCLTNCRFTASWPPVHTIEIVNHSRKGITLFYAYTACIHTHHSYI